MRGVAIIAGLALAPQIGSAQSGSSQEKNVVFIIVDDLKPTLSCFGDKLALTPHVDELASVSNIYQRAYCQQALSGPTRASLLTGLRPDQSGVTELNTWMREKDHNVKTLPQWFRENGYLTYSVGKIFHGDRNSLDAPSWTETPKIYGYTRNEEYQLKKNQIGKKAASYEFTNVDEDCYLDVRIRKEAVRRIESLKGTENPFFLAIGFLKPHLPFCAPKRFLDLYEDKTFEIDTTRIVGAPKIAYHDNQELRGYTDIPNLGPLSLDQQAILKKAYYACTSFMDENVGYVIDALKAKGLYENSVIIFVGDHGYHTGEQGLWCKSTNYEAACRAPLMIHDAAQREKKNVNSIVEFTDIFPTICDLCGLPKPEGVKGKNITVRSGLTGRYAVSEFVRPYRTITHPDDKTHTGYVIRKGHWTYVEWISNDGIVTNSELYRLNDGELERENLSAKHRLRGRYLSSLLHKEIENK